MYKYIDVTLHPFMYQQIKDSTGIERVDKTAGSHIISKKAPVTAYLYTLTLFAIIQNRPVIKIMANSSLGIVLPYCSFFVSIKN